MFSTSYTNGLLRLDGAVQGNAQFCFYVDDINKNSGFSGEVIHMGKGAILVTSLDDAKTERIRGVLGESVYFDGTRAEAEKVILALKANVVKQESFLDLTVIYAYSRLLARSVSLNGERVNLQIAISNGFITVGTPLILGSY